MSTEQLLQSLPAVATLGAALITGFGAAALKRKWDVDAERSRWAREAGARRRSELLDAFSAYLVARPTRASIRQQVSGTGRGEIVDLDSQLGSLRLAAARLLILLDDQEDCQVIDEDIAAVQDWLRGVSRNMTGVAGVPDVTTPEPVLTLARKLSMASEPAPRRRVRVVPRQADARTRRRLRMPRRVKT